MCSRRRQPKVRLLLTLDRGFGDVRSYPAGSHPGIIVLRPEDRRVLSIVTMVETLLDHHDLSTVAGLHAVIQRNVLRVRRPEA